jgi:Mg-chelatase subunit ChlD
MTKDNPSNTEHAHLWFLLDRSGSMEAIRPAVVEGLADFLREQHAADPEALFTLVQFDDVDPHDVVIDARPLADVAPITSDGYQPRGTTPLYDAIGTLVERVDAHVADGGDGADQVVIVLTDGLENASSRFTQKAVFKLVAERRERGWTFAFLGANQDSYAAGGAIGLAQTSTSNWSATPEGTRHAFDLASTATQSRLRGTRASRLETRDQFFEEEQPPEDG